MVASTLSREQASSCHGALFNYLFRHDLAGFELYQAAPPIKAMVVITADRFDWFVEDLAGVEFLKEYITGLTNHSVTCQDTFSVLTDSKKLYKLNTGVYCTEGEYQQDYKIAPTHKEQVQPAIYADAMTNETFQPFLRQQLNGQELVALAGPVTEEPEVTSFC